MGKPLYEWDPDKNASNILKHGISFEVAIAVFQDPYRIDWYDELHSGYNKYGVWEDRYIAIGYVGDVLFVVYTIRDNSFEEVIHIISARKAVGAEIFDYINNRG